MTTLSNRSSTGRFQFLQYVLWGDFLFYTLLGLIMAVDAPAIADWTGLDQNLLRVVGITFIVICLPSIYAAAQTSILRPLGWLALIVNWGGALILAALALTDALSLTSAGNWALGGIALIAGILGDVEYLGVRRLRD